MRAEAERDVRVRIAPDVERVRVVEHRLVAVRRRIQQDHAITCTCTAVPAIDASRVAVRKKLLSGVTQRMSSSTAPGISAGSAAIASHSSGWRVELDQPACDDGARRLRTARDEQARLLHHDRLLDRAAAELDRWPRSTRDRPAACARRSSASGPSRLANSMIAAAHVHHQRLVVEDAVDAHQPLRPRPHLGPVLVAEAEQVRGEPRRERRGEVVDDLELAASDERVDEIVDDASDHRFESLHRLRREPPGDERALLVVRGIVLGDHVLFLRRDPRAVATASSRTRPPAARRRSAVACCTTAHISFASSRQTGRSARIARNASCMPSMSA